MFRIFTDTDCDVSPELAKELDFELLNMPYFINEVEYEPYANFDSHTYYQSLREGTMPKTASLNPAEYIKTFEPFLEQGIDLLYIHFSREMSGSIDNAQLAANELKEKYPERKIELVDTKAISIGALNLLYEASDLYKAGKTLEEIKQFIEDERDHFACYFFAEDLDFFRRSGRVSGISAFIGNLIGIKPIMNMSTNGKLEVIDKQIGVKKVISYIVDKMYEVQNNLMQHKILIASADSVWAEYLKDYLEHKYGICTAEIVTLNPTIGAHCGPGACGICFHSNHR